MCRRLFPRSATLLKKGLRHRCLLAYFAKFLRTGFCTDHDYETIGYEIAIGYETAISEIKNKLTVYQQYSNIPKIKT